MKVALCVIARLENKYIREYVEHYKSLGFDKIFIYDNGRPGEEKIIEELKDLADSGFVEVIDWPNFTKFAQKIASQDCWDKHHNEYDWIAFFDSDEYLILNSAPSISEFMSNKIYDGYDVVTVSIVNYDDNDLIVNDSKSRLKVYTRKCKKDTDIWVKSIVRCKANNVNFILHCSYHIPEIESRDLICNVDGHTNHLNDIFNIMGEEKNTFLKHIPTGCIDDFLRYKNVRKHINVPGEPGLSYFKLYNELTPKKMEYYIKYKQDNL